MASFNELMLAGRIDDKNVCIHGVEIVVRPLTFAQAIEIAQYQEKAKAGDDSAHIELTKRTIKYQVVSPAMTEDEVCKLLDSRGEFVADLLKLIAKETRTEDVEKN